MLRIKPYEPVEHPEEPPKAPVEPIGPNTVKWRIVKKLMAQFIHWVLHRFPEIREFLQDLEARLEAEPGMDLPEIEEEDAP